MSQTEITPVADPLGAPNATRVLEGIVKRLKEAMKLGTAGKSRFVSFDFAGDDIAFIPIVQQLLMERGYIVLVVMPSAGGQTVYVDLHRSRPTIRVQKQDDAK